MVEVFGRSVEGASAEVGVGIKAFRDPALAQDFDAPRLPIDVADFHDYAVDWDADGRSSPSTARRYAAARARRRTRCS